MSEAEAVSLLRRLHEEQGRFYAGKETPGLREILAEDIRWSVPGNNRIAGIYLGRDQVLAYFARRRQLAGNTMTMHIREILTGQGEHIAALTEGRAVLRGRQQSWLTVGLYRLRWGRVAAVWLLPLDMDLFDRLWSATPPNLRDEE